jgi:hypothetical protein
LQRARKLIVWQRWLTGFGIFFAMLGLSCQFTFAGAHVVEFHFLLRDFPFELGACVAIGVSLLASSIVIRRHLRVTAL